jgi:uncharacterized membrane protein
MRTRPDPPSAGRRAAIGLIVGVLAGSLAALVAPWQFAALAGWDTLAIVFIAWAWLSVWPMDGDDTARLATREDSSRPAADLTLIAASVASLVGVALVLLKSGEARGGNGEFALTGIAVVTVVVSWAAVHTIFTLRYAHEYYEGPDGGVEFNEPDRSPDYKDFAYLAFTIGMTFQVSDTNITAQEIRTTALRHALLSYLFGAVILATMINVVAGLLNK